MIDRTLIKYPIFDKNHIRDIYEIDDPDTIREFYILYIRMLNELRETVVNKELNAINLKKLTFLSHKLKSTSFSIGAPALGHVLSRMENAAKMQNEQFEDLLKLFINISQETLMTITQAVD